MLFTVYSNTLQKYLNTNTNTNTVYNIVFEI